MTVSEFKKILDKVPDDFNVGYSDRVIKKRKVKSKNRK